MAFEKRKARKAQKEHEKLEADKRAALAAEALSAKPHAAASVESSAAIGNGGPVAVAPAPVLAAAAETDITMCQKLQEALGRPVILVKESLRDRTLHTAIKHQRGAYAVGMLGMVIATPLTHGLAPLILTGCSTFIPVLDFETFLDKKKVAYNKGVILDQAAIDALRKISEPRREGIAQAAIDVKGSVDGRVTLTGADIADADKAAIAASQAALDTDARPGPVQIGVRMGLAVVGSGLLLLALTVIPEDIHTLITRVASLILVVGVLIIGGALANGSWLKGQEVGGRNARRGT